MRLMKLARLLRANRLFQRFENRISTPYAYRSLIFVFFLIFLFGHWMACGWSLTYYVGRGVTAEEETWVSFLEDNKPREYERTYELYLASLYFR